MQTIEARLADRYREAAPGALPWNTVIDTLVAHRSVRSYTAEPVPPGTLETMVAAAQSAATSSNLQTWSVVTVEDPAARARLSEIAGNQKHIVEAPLFMVWLADLSRAARIGDRAGQDLEGLAFLETFLVAAMDAALAAQNAVVAAESLGLGGVYIGALRNNVGAVAAELGLPPGVMPIFGLCVGHPDPAKPASVKPRLPQHAVLHRGRYSTDGEVGLVEGFDASLTAFQAEQGMAPQGWMRLVRDRVGTVAALRGRDRLFGAIQALGFGMR